MSVHPISPFPRAYHFILNRFDCKDNRFRPIFQFIRSRSKFAGTDLSEEGCMV
jgi:hypothetical protein